MTPWVGAGRVTFHRFCILASLRTVSVFEPISEHICCFEVEVLSFFCCVNSTINQYSGLARGHSSIAGNGARSNFAQKVEKYLRINQLNLTEIKFCNMIVFAD